jgi:hypothetical protein
MPRGIVIERPREEVVFLDEEVVTVRVAIVINLEINLEKTSRKPSWNTDACRYV